MKVRRKQTWPVGPGRARILAATVALVAVGGITVTFVSSGGKGTAYAETSLQDFVPIEDVAANVMQIKPQRAASTGVFTVDCGTNGNGKFSPDNPVAQPGIKNGAEHVHDFVGNQAITADTSDEALAASGTTCENGDRSSYFWPVVRIDKAVRADVETQAKALAATQPLISCPRVADRLPAVPQAATSEVKRQLSRLDRQLADANARVAASKGQIDADFNNSVIEPLRVQRADAIKRISAAIGRAGTRPTGMVSLVDCEVSYDGMHAGHGAAVKQAPARTRAAANPSVRCPSVRDRLPGVPARAVDEVNRDLALLDRQISEANERLVSSRGAGGPDFVNNAIMRPLKDKRSAAIDRMAVAIGRDAPRPEGLDALAACTLRNGDTGPADQDEQNQGDQGQGNGGEQGGEAPEALPDPAGPNLELPGNTGGIVRPAEVLIEYRGNPTSKVTPMPRFLRALTGDAKPTSRGPANARATWTCSGFADRLSTKYPICPDDSQVMRVQDFPGCWDGENIDSENHRAHLSFADATSGACPDGFVAIPQLRISISYDIPSEVQRQGQFALDSFPEENHNPFSDHNDFINVNSERTMEQIASCINTGKKCS